MRKIKTGEHDYTLSESEREEILSRTASVYRKGIFLRFTKWFFYLLAFFVEVLPKLSWNINNRMDFVRLLIASCCFVCVIVWQAVRLIKAFCVRKKLNTLDDSTLAVVFREVKNPVETRAERWKAYLFSTLLLLLVTAGLDFLSFGALIPFFTDKNIGVLYLLLGASKFCIIIERAYEEKTQADFYITSCHLF